MEGRQHDDYAHMRSLVFQVTRRDPGEIQRRIAEHVSRRAEELFRGAAPGHLGWAAFEELYSIPRQQHLFESAHVPQRSGGPAPISRSYVPYPANSVQLRPTPFHESTSAFVHENEHASSSSFVGFSSICDQQPQHDSWQEVSAHPTSVAPLLVHASPPMEAMQAHSYSAHLVGTSEQQMGSGSTPQPLQMTPRTAHHCDATMDEVDIIGALAAAKNIGICRCVQEKRGLTCYTIPKLVNERYICQLCFQTIVLVEEGDNLDDCLNGLNDDKKTFEWIKSILTSENENKKDAYFWHCGEHKALHITQSQASKPKEDPITEPMIRPDMCKAWCSTCFKCASRYHIYRCKHRTGYRGSVMSSTIEIEGCSPNVSLGSTEAVIETTSHKLERLQNIDPHAAQLISLCAYFGDARIFVGSLTLLPEAGLIHRCCLPHDKLKHLRPLLGALEKSDQRKVALTRLFAVAQSFFLLSFEGDPTYLRVHDDLRQWAQAQSKETAEVPIRLLCALLTMVIASNPNDHQPCFRQPCLTRAEQHAHSTTLLQHVSRHQCPEWIPLELLRWVLMEHLGSEAVVSTIEADMPVVLSRWVDSKPPAVLDLPARVATPKNELTGPHSLLVVGGATTENDFVDKELQELQKMVRFRPVVKRTVSAAELLRDAYPFDFFHYAGHLAASEYTGETMTLQLSKNNAVEMVTADNLVGILQHSRLVVINGCNSDGLGEKLASAGVANVIGWSDMLLSDACLPFALAFYQTLQEFPSHELEHNLNQCVRKAHTKGKAAIRVQTSPHVNETNGTITYHQMYEFGRASDSDCSGGLTNVGVPYLFQPLRETNLHCIPVMPVKLVTTPIKQLVRDYLLRDACNPVMCTIGGVVGVGKSTEAKRIARDIRVQTTCHDGVYWISAGRDRDASDILKRLCELLEINSTGTQTGQVRAIKQFLAGKACLIIIDDIWDNEIAKAVEDLASNSIRLLFTSRNESGLGAYFNLDKLHETAAKELFAHTSGRTQSELMAEDSSAYAQLIASCRGIPALIIMLARCCFNHGLTQTLKNFITGQERFAALRLRACDGYQNLYAGLEIQMNNLREVHPLLHSRFSMLGIFPEDTLVPEAMLENLWLLDGKQVMQLEAKSLLCIASALTSFGFSQLEDDIQILKREALISREGIGGSIAQTDVQGEFLRHTNEDRLPQWHAQLLLTCGLPVFDGTDTYFSHRLVLHHIVGAASGWESATIDEQKKLCHTLKLENASIDGSIAKALALAVTHCQTWRNLHTLTLIANGLGDAGLETFVQVIDESVSKPHGAALVHLNKLDLVANEIRGRGLEKLVNIKQPALKSLNYLSLSSNCFGHIGMKAMSSGDFLLRLRTLVLGKTNFDDNAMKIFAQVIKEKCLPELQTLRLHSNAIGDEGMMEFIRSCSHARSKPHVRVLVQLEDLQVDGNNISMKSVRFFSNFLADGVLPRLQACNQPAC